MRPARELGIEHALTLQVDGHVQQRARRRKLQARRPELIGEPYVDGSGEAYLPMFGLPVLVYAASAAGMARAFGRARQRGLTLAVYTDDLFATDNDVDNRAAVARVAIDDLKLAGFAVTGPRRDVDKALDKLRLHP